MKLTKLFREFVRSERSAGVVLIACTLFSLLAANLFPVYNNFWNIDIAGQPLLGIINDGLMTIFFLLIGLELEREVYIGELSNIKNALLPVIAAVGGMIVPALVYYLINVKSGETSGVGIPMATDIAFALGALTMVGRGVPTSLRVFLTALAVIDDLGAILIIAIFYTSSINWLYLAMASASFILMLVMNRLKVHQLWPYLIGGIFMWYCMHHSGVHATITGVLLAFAIPFEKGGEASVSYRLQRWLHRPVAFIVLPIFALANTSIIINSDFHLAFAGAVSAGVMAGLFVGKPLGIVMFSYTAVKSRLCKLPEDLSWRHLIGAGILGGIGFTMSIFITMLAFDDPELIDQAKISIILISVVAGFTGYIWLKTQRQA